MNEHTINSFREKLDAHYTWPAVYLFKFIVPVGKEDEVKKLFPGHTPSEKLSKQGNYVSVTAAIHMVSSDAVIDIYIKASAIEGIVAL